MSARIVCAALRHANGRIICGVRHYDAIMMSQIEADGGDWRGAEQGFVDRDYNFVTREQAWIQAAANNQILRDPDWFAGLLHSEHLY